MLSIEVKRAKDFVTDLLVIIADIVLVIKVGWKFIKLANTEKSQLICKLLKNHDH